MNRGTELTEEEKSVILSLSHAKVSGNLIDIIVERSISEVQKAIITGGEFKTEKGRINSAKMSQTKTCDLVRHACTGHFPKGL